MSQSNTDVDEFINKQIEILKQINTNEIKEMQNELADKNKKIQSLTDELTQLHETIKKYENESVHKNKDLELTIRELELNVKMLEEDKGRIECENTLLVEELLAFENDTKLMSIRNNEVSFEKAKPAIDTNNKYMPRIKELENRIDELESKNDQYVKNITK